MARSRIKRRLGIAGLVALAVGVIGVAALADAGRVPQLNNRLIAEYAPMMDGQNSVALKRSRAGMPMALPMAAHPGAVFDATSSSIEGTGSAGPSVSEKIERSGSISVEVRKGAFDKAWNKAFAIATQYGGRVMTSSRGRTTTTDDTSPLAGRIVIRVPAKAFETTLGALRHIGSVRGDSSDAQDVTEEYVDLASQLRNLRAEQTALIKLFDRSNNVRDTLAVQTRLSNVEGQIERITGRIKFIDTRTTFSYIDVNVAEPGAPSADFLQQATPSFNRAWDTAWRGLVRIAFATLIGAIWVSPFVVLGVLIYLARRRRTSDEVAPQEG